MPNGKPATGEERNDSFCKTAVFGLFKFSKWILLTNTLLEFGRLTFSVPFYSTLNLEMNMFSVAFFELLSDLD
jgi:hypothetical protein